MIRPTNRQRSSIGHQIFRIVTRISLLSLLLICQYTPCAAGEAEVEASLAALKDQSETIHQRTLTLMDDLNKAWDEFHRDPTPANEARINKLKDDFDTLNNLSRENWKWIQILGDQRSTTVNFIREVLGQAQQTLDSGVELARGVIPGATYILGVSQETLYNERWKDTEAAFNALLEKGRDLRKRHEAIKANIREKLKDTPENQEELKKLEEEIAIWKSKIQTMSEIYEFLRSDMPAEVVFWNELTGPYVEALYDNIKNNLEEIILWDTLGGTSPAERLYKLFKPALQLKLGETFFSDPVLTDMIRNKLVMEVLFAGADLDRAQKSIELGVGNLLDSDSVKKAATELLGNPARRAELQRMLQQMSYDRIPAKAQGMLTKMGEKIPGPGSGTLERFVASGLTADEINRLKKINNSKAVADGIMKVANEFIGPALNWSAFSTAYATTKEECTIYRAAYKQLRAAKIVGAGTFTGVGGTVSTSAEDNFVNTCFDNPALFGSYLEKLKETYKGVNVEQYAIKETFRKKTVEPVNDELVTSDPEAEEGGGSYESWGAKLAKLYTDLWENAVAAEAVGPLRSTYFDAIHKILGENLLRIQRQNPECIGYLTGDYNKCPPGIKAAIDREKATANTEAARFFTHYYPKVQEEMPPLAATLAKVIKASKIDKIYPVKSNEKFIDTYLEKEGINVMLGADEVNKRIWWGGYSGLHRSEEVRQYLLLLLDESRPTLDSAVETYANRLKQLNHAISWLSSYLEKKKTEKEAILTLAATLEQVADHLGERRNFFVVAQSTGWTMTSFDGWTPEAREVWDAGHFNVDDFIALHGSYTTVFSRLFDAEMARYQGVLDQLKEFQPKVQQAANAAEGIPGLLNLLDDYAKHIEKLSKGFYTTQSAVSELNMPIFSLGISSTAEGGLWLELLGDELKTENITTQQELDFFLSPEADRSFPTFFDVKPISHPVLRTFVTPDQTRLSKARSILGPAYVDIEDLISQYAQVESSANDIQREIDRQLKILSAGVRGVSPGFADSINWQTLEMRKTVGGYNDWLSLSRPVSEYPRLPDSLWQDLIAQEKGLIDYRVFVKRIRLNPPVVVDREVKEAVVKLEGIFAKVESEGNSWLDYEPSRFSTVMNDFNGTAYKIYEQMYNKGKAPNGGPVAAAYLKILGATSKINNIRITRETIANVIQVLSHDSKEVDDFLSRFETIKEAVTTENIQSWIAMLTGDIQPGSQADAWRSNSSIKALIEKIEGQLASLKGLKTAGDDRALQAIRDFYQQFKMTYESRDDSGIMSFMGDEWEAGDGTTLADMQVNLSRMFRKFDELKMAIDNLQIFPMPQQGYMVNYDVTISSRIYNKNLRHQEKSSVSEQVSFGENGKPRIVKTLNGRYWFVE